MCSVTVFTLRIHSAIILEFISPQNFTLKFELKILYRKSKIWIGQMKSNIRKKCPENFARRFRYEEGVCAVNSHIAYTSEQKLYRNEVYQENLDEFEREDTGICLLNKSLCSWFMRLSTNKSQTHNLLGKNWRQRFFGMLKNSCVLNTIIAKAYGNTIKILKTTLEEKRVIAGQQCPDLDQSDFFFFQNF